MEDAEIVQAKCRMNECRNANSNVLQWWDGSISVAGCVATDRISSLHKGASQNALALCYGRTSMHVPSQYACGKCFTMEHAFSCPYGGFPLLWHNDIRDTTACLLGEVCHNVASEPSLMLLPGERLRHKTANTEDGARLDTRAQGFWGERHQSAFLMQVF